MLLKVILITVKFGSFVLVQYSTVHNSPFLIDTAMFGDLKRGTRRALPA